METHLLPKWAGASLFSFFEQIMLRSGFPNLVRGYITIFKTMFLRGSFRIQLDRLQGVTPCKTITSNYENAPAISYFFFLDLSLLLPLPKSRRVSQYSGYQIAEINFDYFFRVFGKIV